MLWVPLAQVRDSLGQTVGLLGGGSCGCRVQCGLMCVFIPLHQMLRFVCDSGVKFVTTSAGSPAKFVAPLKDAGITVYHAVPTVDAALKCVDAGVDGLIVEGLARSRRSWSPS